MSILSHNTKLILIQYRKHRPMDEEFRENAARARLRFAGNAILAEVKERNKKWTWGYFSERRDDRERYVELFQKKLIASLMGNVCLSHLLTARAYSKSRTL